MHSRPTLTLAFCLSALLSACNGGGGGGGSASNSSSTTVVVGASSNSNVEVPITQEVAQQQEIAQLQQQMNQEPQYQISNDELTALAEEGAITPEEQQELAQLLIQNQQ